MGYSLVYSIFHAWFNKLGLSIKIRNIIIIVELISSQVRAELESNMNTIEL